MLLQANLGEVKWAGSCESSEPRSRPGNPQANPMQARRPELTQYSNGSSTLVKAASAIRHILSTRGSRPVSCALTYAWHPPGSSAPASTAAWAFSSLIRRGP
jgi:hypothetical protein